ERRLRVGILTMDGGWDVRWWLVRRSRPRLMGEASIATGRMLSGDAASALVEDVVGRVGSVLPGLDLAVAVEGQKQGADLVERIHAAAARNGGVRDLHNVTVEREADGSLHLTMHAKLPVDQTLAQAS